MSEYWLLTGDSLEWLKRAPDQSVQCVVTSPPYWGLRDYGSDDQLGLEATPDEYVANMVTVFREVRRVLRDDGVLWLNLGDSYVSSPPGNRPGQHSTSSLTNPQRQDALHHGQRRTKDFQDLKPKDLVGIPWRVAFALQADGWYLRSDIIWAKPNPMPESVKDRPTKVHEYVFLLTKSARYFYDHEAIKEPCVSTTPFRFTDGGKDKQRGHGRCHAGFNGRYAERIKKEGAPKTRNARSVWTIATRPFKEAHFAVFPPDLAEKCVLAGTSERGACAECGAPWKRIVKRKTENASNAAKAGTVIEGKGHPSSQVRDNHDIRNGPISTTKTTGWKPTCKCDSAQTVPCTVLDPFSGAATTGLVALQHGRSFIGIELNPEYNEIASRRLEEHLSQAP